MAEAPQTEVGQRPRRLPKQARSRATRRRVLEAAVACFEEHGYDETTTAAIARRAGIAVGTLYGYFSDKRQILLELLDGTVNQIANYVVDSLEPGAWLEQGLRTSLRQVIDALLHTRTFNPGMQRILWERYFKDEDFRRAVQRIEDRVRAALMRLLRTLAEEGRLRVRNLHAAAFVVYTSVEWVSNRLMLGEADADIDAVVDEVTDMMCRYLFRDDAV